MTRNYSSRLALFSVLGIILSFFVYVAALPIRYLRITFGRMTFLLSSIASTALLASFDLWLWAIVYASICMLIGAYRELEEMSVFFFIAASLAVVATAIIHVLVFFGFFQFSVTPILLVSNHRLLCSNTLSLVYVSVNRCQSLKTFLWKTFSLTYHHL